MGPEEITKKTRIRDLVKVTSLRRLDARWIDGMGRRGLGVEMECPNAQHQLGDGPADRVRLFFLNPVDGGPPIPNLHRYYYRIEDTLEHLTLERSDQRDYTIDIEGHWHGSIIEGEAVDVLRFGW